MLGFPGDHNLSLSFPCRYRRPMLMSWSRIVLTLTCCELVVTLLWPHNALILLVWSKCRGVNPAGDRGDTPPPQKKKCLSERGDGNTSCPLRYGALCRMLWFQLASNYINIFISVFYCVRCLTWPVLRVRSLDPKAVCHRPSKFPTRFTPLSKWYIAVRC